MLDLKDRKILYELDINSRASLSQIGKRVGLSKESVYHRIERLKKEGVIKSFSAMVDIGKLGYTSFRILLNLQNISPKKEEEIKGFLKREPIVGWFVTIEGSWDLNIWLVCKTIKEISDFWDRFKEKYLAYIADSRFSTYSELNYFSKKYLINKTKPISFKIMTPPSNEKIDGIELKILEFLVKNARISSVDMATKLKTTAKTISKKIRQLEKKKVIIGYTTLLDISKMGYSYYKIDFKLSHVNKKTEREFRDYLRNHPNVIYEDLTIGGSDIEMELQTKGKEELRKILEEIKERFYTIISDYQILSFLKEHKYTLLPIDLEEKLS